MSLPTPFIRVLHLEDSSYDADLIRGLFEAEGLPVTIQRVSTGTAYEAALNEAEFDVILTDYTVPGYDGAAALKLAREKQPRVPVIVISGSIGDEQAVKCLKLGATDYLLKDRLDRLVAAVKRALHETTEQQSRRQAEAALRQSEERFALVARATSDAIWDWNILTGEVWWGGDYAATFGFSNGATTTFSAWAERIHPDDRSRIDERLAAIHNTAGIAWTDEYRLRRDDGSYAYVIDRSFLIRDARGRPIRMVGGVADVTRQRVAERRLAAIFESAPVAVGYAEPDGRILNVNSELCSLFGYTRDEMVGRTADELRLWHSPQERAEAFKRLRREKRLQNFEAKFRRKSGASWTALLSMELIDQIDDQLLLIMLVDISERKALQAQLQRLERVESVGMLASGIAHDMNNILAPILMGAPLLRMALPPKDVESTLATIEACAQRGAALVRQLLIFGRGVEGERLPVRLPEVIKANAKIAAETFPKKIAIVARIDPNLWRVRGDTTQLHQVILNLCVNARDAMPDGGALTISAQNAELSGRNSAPAGDAPPGRYVVIRVSDTGTGIPPELVDRIFDPFFTTKEVGKGTGLGLSTALGIVKSHGGFVRVQTQVGQGTTMEVGLPAIFDEEPAVPDNTRSAAAQGRGEAVLVVDDEENIRTMLRRVLVRNNYTVFSAQDGVEATAVFAASPEIKLVVTDLDMPLMDGVGLARALRRLNPSVRIVISTGLSDRGSTEKRREVLRELQVSAVLPKPYSHQVLLTTIREALDRTENVPPSSGN